MEKFFYICSSFDSAELTEFLLRRYGQLDVFYNMPILEFFPFLKKAREQEKDERIFKEWCALIPRFNDVKYLDYEYFKAVRLGTNIDMRSAEEIIAEIDRAHEKVK